MIPKIGLPGWVLIGVVLGIATGLVLGERTAALEPVSSAYTMLLEIAIFPYLVCALILGLGRLAPDRVGRLLRAGWPPFVFVWVLALAEITLLRQAFPPTPPPFVLRPEPATSIGGLIAVLIPANPFVALTTNDVPAIVVLALIYGIGVQGVAQRATLFDVLESIRAASLAIWKWIVLLTPIGVFALLAQTAGTLQADQFAGFILYNILFMTGTIVLGLVALPLALAAIAPISYGALMAELRPGFTLALITGLPVVALPYVERTAATVARAAGCPEGQETDDVIKATVSLAYGLSQVGNHFCVLLVYFAAYRDGHSLPVLKQVLLPFLTVLSCVGTPSTAIGAVQFFSTWLGLPASTTELWIATTAVTRYGQVLASVGAFGFIAGAVPLVYCGKLRLRLPRAVVAMGLPFGVLAALVVLATVLRPVLFPADQSDAAMTRTIDPELSAGLAVQVLPAGTLPASVPVAHPPDVMAVQRAGVLRVGYNPNVIPFSYFNRDGALVGYDISFAYKLARDLAVRLEFLPFTWDSLAGDLAAGRFDLAVSGIYLTDGRLASLTPGPTYWATPVALLAPSATAPAFTSRAALLTRRDLRLAVFDSDVMHQLARTLFPNAAITPVPDYGALPALAGKVDAALWTLTQAAAWARDNPGWTAVVPSDTGGSQPIAIMLPPGAAAFRAYLDAWMRLQEDSGFTAEQKSYWIDGIPRRPPEPRWNLLDALTGAQG
jgi:Na+/H+-dicarboxylate symporter/ABC-type amino acid transport substrate-binding protein